MKASIYNNDCFAILQKLDANSIHSIVTDPPAGIGFLGHEWDKDKGGRDAWILWLTAIMKECHRVLKPGGHAIVWALPRTSHWSATAIENSGFEIRDVITHVFTSGVPAAGDLGPKVDRKLGLEPLTVGYRKSPSSRYYCGNKPRGKVPILEPSSDEGKKWSGWMPKLKPASEHWILARKPLGTKTLADNAIEYGTGSLNINGCRVAKERTRQCPDSKGLGRMPTNFLLSHDRDCGEVCSDSCAVKLFDRESGLNTEEYFNTFIYSSKAPARERREGVNFDN